MSASRCRFCDHANPESARFCNACGSPLHLKPCPQCEAVNDTNAERCYECGAALETGVPSNAVAATEVPAVASGAEKAQEPQHIPEALGARLDELPPMEGFANVTAAQRRDDFVRSRKSGAMFFAGLVLIVGALGYYGYAHRSGPDYSGAPVVAAAHDENQPVAAVEQQPPAVAGANVATPAAPDATPAATDANQSMSAKIPDGSPESASAVATTQPAEATQPATAQETTPPPLDVAPPKNVRQSTGVKAASRPRPSAASSAGKADPDHYSRPAAATDASAQATQRMIERYLGIRAGVSTHRSVQ